MDRICHLLLMLCLLGPLVNSAGAGADESSDRASCMRRREDCNGCRRELRDAARAHKPWTCDEPPCPCETACEFAASSRCQQLPPAQRDTDPCDPQRLGCVEQWARDCVALRGTARDAEFAKLYTVADQKRREERFEQLARFLKTHNCTPRPTGKK